ncbi:MAG: hypothetical protein OXE40_11545 [Gammaproteobacteria bacterium]|nr:hypothetical protein [Gammaproteobacteria bacterium]
MPSRANPGAIIVALVAVCGLAICCQVPAYASSSKAHLPEAMAIGSSDTAGPIYTTAEGMTLYRNGMDQPEEGTFGCSDTRHERTPGEEGYPIPGAAFRSTCVNRWRPYRAGPDAVTQGDFGIVERPDGVRQWAFDGSPLYTSTRDLAPGDVNGTMGFGSYGRWRTVPVETWFPPGVGLVRKVQGLLLASEDDGLLFAPGAATETGAGAGNSDWLPVSAPELARPGDEFTIVDRADGSRQWAFRGQALYRPRADLPRHRIQRIVESGRWQPLVFQPARPRPEFVTMHMSVPEIGWVYGDAEDQTLYVFYCFDRAPDGLHCDEPGDAAAHRSAVCGTGEQCAREWRPVSARPDQLAKGNWGVADVPHPPFADPTGAYGEGVPTVRAWTWFGRPVYTFAGDRIPGDVLGHTIEARSSGFGVITVLGDEFPVMP